MSFSFSTMPPFKEQGCCDDGCACASSNPPATSACPSCGALGELVSNLTVYSLTQKEYKEDINRSGDDGFAICMNPKCECAYYNSVKQLMTQQMKRDFDFKESATTHYVCYCLNITKEQIIETIKEKKLTGMQDIMKEIQGPPPCSCEKNNPTGLCCDEKFNNLIKERLKAY